MKAIVTSFFVGALGGTLVNVAGVFGAFIALGLLGSLIAYYSEDVVEDDR